MHCRWKSRAAVQASWKGCGWAIGVSAYRDIADSQARLRANTDSFHNLSNHIIETLFLSRFLCLVRPNGFYARNPNKSKYIWTKMLYFPALFWEFGLEPIKLLKTIRCYCIDVWWEDCVRGEERLIFSIKSSFDDVVPSSPLRGWRSYYTHWHVG